MGTLHSVRRLNTTYLLWKGKWGGAWEREGRHCWQVAVSGPMTSLCKGSQPLLKDKLETVPATHDQLSTHFRHANFGDIGMACKELVDEFQKHTTNTKRMNTIEDMQNFVENFSEFSAAQRNAGKHVTLVSELSRVVDARSLMRVGLGSFKFMLEQATMLSVSRHHPLGKHYLLLTPQADALAGGFKVELALLACRSAAWSRMWRLAAATS